MKFAVLLLGVIFSTTTYAEDCAKVLNHYGNMTKSLRSSKKLAAFAIDAEKYQKFIDDMKDLKKEGEAFTDEEEEELDRRFTAIRVAHLKNLNQANSQINKVNDGYFKVSDCISDNYSSENEKMEEYSFRFREVVLEGYLLAHAAYTEADALLTQYRTKKKIKSLKPINYGPQDCEFPGLCSSSINDSRLQEKENKYQNHPAEVISPKAKNV